MFIRIRPESSHDGSDEKCLTVMNDKTLRLSVPEAFPAPHYVRKSVPAIDDKLFVFDKIFGEDSRQEDLYSSVEQHVKATIKGYNTTIFALGCTGSGKTFTMTGNAAAPGIIPRAISEVFSQIEATAAKETNIFFYVRISFVELYNNSFRSVLI